MNRRRYTPTDVFTYVDPFLGNGKIELPKPEGIAATWFFLKAQTGNTHPAACRPLNMVSAGPYSGAYPTGYGTNALSTHADVPQIYDVPCASGFSHFHQCGPGAIGRYYNYVRVSPLSEGLEQLGTVWPLIDEAASPGYYRALLGDTGIEAKLTVVEKAAFHVYTFPAGARNVMLAVDLSAGGLDQERILAATTNDSYTRKTPGIQNLATIPSEADIEILSSTSAQGFVTMAGITIYVYLETDMLDGSCKIWQTRRTIDDSQLTLNEIRPANFVPFGLLFQANSDKACMVNLRIGFSLKSAQKARTNLTQIQKQDFRAIVRDTQRQWGDYLNRVVVQGGTETQRTVFYSCLYHSLKKPASFVQESPFWQEEDFYVDFATMWDQYKTQLPLLLTMYPKRGREIVKALISYAGYYQMFPNTMLLSTESSIESKQARALAWYTLADAYYRKIPGINWQRALDLMEQDLAHYDDFLTTGQTLPRLTHTLDLAGACFCLAQIAKSEGRQDLYHKTIKLATCWKNVYDPASGLLKAEGEYYEGGLWNYSFRLLHDMAGRIQLYPTEKDFVNDLDLFFGYGQPAIQQPTDVRDRDYMRWGFSLNRFEGFNNEPDMETPYAYLYAGRHDRTAEVVRAGMTYMFTTGRGGLPGNNDSGGLSSCYVWNAIGLFPVTGQSVFLIGSPLFDQSTLTLPQAPLTIIALNNSATSIYVQKAVFNGQLLSRAYLSVDEVLAGGELVLTMGETPSQWAQRERPPSL